MGAKKPRLKFAIVCDDIREEVGRKLSFMGVYGQEPDVIVPHLPFLFPKLCFALSFVNLKGGDEFSIELVDPAGRGLGAMNGRVPQGITQNVKFPLYPFFSPVKVEAEGLHRLSVTVNEDDKDKQVTWFNLKLTEKPE